LKAASPIELGQQSAQFNVFLCPVYLRGEAYLMLHDGNAAAAEFQKFIDHYGLVVNFPWGALARLGWLALTPMQGDTTKARAAYQDFLTLWKDADPDVPILNKPKPSTQSCFGVDVFEDEDLVILVDLLRGNFTGDDLAEKAIVHKGL
jgi:eukaryotic-like serine/threonine-protein kinase